MTRRFSSWCSASRSCSAALVGFVLVSAAACKSTPSNSAPAAPATPASSTPPAAVPVVSAAVAKVAAPASLDVSWTDPAGWKRVQPSSPMRKAGYEIPAAAGDKEAGQLAVFYFGAGQGGSVEANVQRWVGQFAGVAPSAVERSEQTLGGLKVHLVEIASGTYTDSMAAMRGGSSAPSEGYGLLGAIVETTVGPYFFKLTGPASTVKAARPEFIKLLESVHGK